MKLVLDTNIYVDFAAGAPETRGTLLTRDKHFQHVDQIETIVLPSSLA
jgi:predicted nucleic acid-binding protein